MNTNRIFGDCCLSKQIMVLLWTRRDDSVKYPAQSNETSDLTQKNANDANNEIETMQIANAA